MGTDGDEGAAQAGSHTVGPGVRGAVAVFLTVFVACGLLGLEAWPFSGWELFSHVRTAEVRGWLATAVGADAVERPIPFGSFAPGHRGELQVLKGFDGLSPDERRGVCRAWAAEMARVGAGEIVEIVEIRVYATTDPTRGTSTGTGGGGGQGRRDLRHLCPEP